MLSACQSTSQSPDLNTPLTAKTIGPAYADYAMEMADKNKDNQITLLEWTSSGGTPRSFELLDENRDGVITRTELIRFGSSARFMDFSRRYADVNRDNQLTPQEFRSAAGVRLLRLDF